MSFKKLINPHLAARTLLVAMGLLLLFHILVLLKIVPSDIVWAGQAESSLLMLELLAIGVTLLFALVIAAKIGYIKVGKLQMLVTIAMWLVTIFFALNTLGNLASGVSAENLIFAPITIILTVLALRLALE